MSGRLHFVVALRAEARPIIRHFGLTVSGSQGPHRLLSSPDGVLNLLVTGPGREAAAAAVTRLRETKDSAWLNVGIAGHAEHRVGTAFLAHSIVDAATGRAWYPPLVFDPPCPTASVRTVARACLDFPTDDLYDMEACGFYEAASRCASHELVHCLKVVSDNRDRPASSLTGDRVSELVFGNLATIAAAAEILRGLAVDVARTSAEPAGFHAILSRAHFTTTQRRQLRRLLRRFAALCPDDDVASWIVAAGDVDAGSVISRLEQNVERKAPSFPDTP